MIRHATLLFLLLAGAFSLVMFSVKYEVQDLEVELSQLNRSIIADRQAIHVLKAEWSHLNNPQRLRLLASRHLGLKPVETKRGGTISGLPKAPSVDDQRSKMDQRAGNAALTGSDTHLPGKMLAIIADWPKDKAGQ